MMVPGTSFPMLSQKNWLLWLVNFIMIFVWRGSDDVGHVDLKLDEKAVALSEVNSQRLKKLSGKSETLHTILY